MWGLNKQGQCGLGSKEAESVAEPHPLDLTMKSIKAISLVCGRNHSAILTNDGGVYTYGATSYGRLGLGVGKDRSTSLKKVQDMPREVRYFRNYPVKHIASGDFHMLALTHDSNVHSWGMGIDGQLGHWDSVGNLNSPRKIDCFDVTNSSSREGSPVVDISCGSSWSTAVTAKGALYVWGNGDGGQLGIEPPKDLPFLNEDDTPLLSTLCSSIIESSDLSEEKKYVTQSCSFDSKFNVLVPIRIDERVHEANLAIEKVR
jgi:alpha-tubulin suppressor-like RCC1 family protein